MNVLVLGGAGRVGAMVVRTLSARHRVRVGDLSGDGPAAAHELRTVDVTDYASVRDAAQGQDAVVYLAMGRRGPWGEIGGWAESHFDVNVKGLYLTLRAAADAGIHRCVHASSLSVFQDYLVHGHDLEHRAPDATDGYGLTKRLGEQVCVAASREHGLQSVSLQLCGPLPDDEWHVFAGRCPAVMTAASDVATAFERALAYDTDGHESFIVTGDHDQTHIRWERTRDRLGWEPLMRRRSSLG